MVRGVRGKYDIILEILTICKNGANKTRIVCRANLNSKTAGAYLKILIYNGLISVERDSPKLYQTTLKGMNLIKTLSQIDSELVPIYSLA